MEVGGDGLGNRAERRAAEDDLGLGRAEAH